MAVLLDRSGSMESIKSDTEGGFNAFITEQRKQRLDIRVTLAQFDTEYDVVFANRPVADVPPLELQPRGATALYDAVGRLITDVGAELAALPEEQRPGRVTVVVLTDGHENSSKEWTHDAVRKAIHRQEREYSWDFVFLGANMDAVAIGQQLGFAADRSMTYAADADGVGAAWAATSDYVVRRIAVPVGAPVAGFSEEDRAAARGER
ncbi:VWA domain-containing protein [Mycolicibacterium sp. GF69]|nr:VWA domain-containing protein [Mycolicibacterium sp. GF69]